MSLRDQLEDAIEATENEIQKVLQRFHDNTGMIPRDITFECIDVKSNIPHEPRKVILVSHVNLTANT